MGQALTLAAPSYLGGPFHIVQTETNVVIIPEIELG